MRVRYRGGLVLLTLLALLVTPAAPSLAQEVAVSGSQRVLGELREARLTISLSGGATARGHLLSFPASDPRLRLRPHLARNRVTGIEPVTALARRQLDRGAVAGTNGGYWVNRPSGVPNGLHVRSGHLVAGQAATVSGHETSRASLGIKGTATVMDRVDVAMSLHRPGGGPHRIDEINREPRISGRYPRPVSGELLVYTPRYGATVAVPSNATAVITDELAIGSSGRAAATVRRVLGGSRRLNIPSGQSLLVAHGTSRSTLAGLSPGHRIAVSSRVTPSGTDAGRWQDLDHALAAGPLLLRGGRSPSVAQMQAEAFSNWHVTSRQPRTAVARTSNGRMLLVTVDGRRPGWSDGVSLPELVRVLRELGATDAVNLDGGGSTTSLVNGQVRNRPSERGRSVADGLFVHAPPPPSARPISAHACPRGDVPSTRFRDTAGSVHTAAVDCLAWWGVTRGQSSTRYVPGRSVTRDQMASFLARWIDSASDRGLLARPLPPLGFHRFSDVPRDSVHAGAINRLAMAGIVEGRDDGRYEPRRAVTRAQMASMVRRAHDYVSGSSLPAFRDTFVDDNGSVHENSIDRLAGVRVVTGTGGFSYAPGRAVRRDAMASFLMRAADRLVEQGVTRPPR